MTSKIVPGNEWNDATKLVHRFIIENIPNEDWPRIVRFANDGMLRDYLSNVSFDIGGPESSSNADWLLTELFKQVDWDTLQWTIILGWNIAIYSRRRRCIVANKIVLSGAWNMPTKLVYKLITEKVVFEQDRRAVVIAAKAGTLRAKVEAMLDVNGPYTNDWVSWFFDKVLDQVDWNTLQSIVGGA